MTAPKQVLDEGRFPVELMAAIGFAGIAEPSSGADWVAVHYQARPEFTHSHGQVVQGGFITAWLDHAMARAVMTRDPNVGVASLEIKVSFLARVGQGPSIAEARVLRWGRSIVFLEALLKSPEGELLATASSSIKLIHPRPAT